MTRRYRAKPIVCDDRDVPKQIGRPPIDRIGQRSGKLVVIELSSKKDGRKNGHSIFWVCRCDCGKLTTVRGEHLIHPKRATKSCGCLRSKLVDITGRRYGSLIVLGLSRYRKIGKHKTPTWSCRCDCGKEVEVISGLLGRNTASCGCSRRLDRNGLATESLDEAGRRDVMRSYKSHAKKANRPWELTDAQASALFRSACHYCGVPPSNSRKNPAKSGGAPFVYNGIDRVDPSVGYLASNVVACCKMCNFAKRHIPYAEFMAWVKRLATHQTATPAD